MIQKIKTSATTQWILERSRNAKRIIALCVDVSSNLIATWGSFYVRLGDIPIINQNTLKAYILSVLIIVPLFIKAGLYRAIFRYSGLPALLTVIKAMAIYALIYSLIFMFYGFPEIPRTIGVIQPSRFQESSATGLIWAPHEPEAV